MVTSATTEEIDYTLKIRPPSSQNLYLEKETDILERTLLKNDNLSLKFYEYFVKITFIGSKISNLDLSVQSISSVVTSSWSLWQVKSKSV